MWIVRLAIASVALAATGCFFKSSKPTLEGALKGHWDGSYGKFYFDGKSQMITIEKKDNGDLATANKAEYRVIDSSERANTITIKSTSKGDWAKGLQHRFEFNQDRNGADVILILGPMPSAPQGLDVKLGSVRHVDNEIRP